MWMWKSSPTRIPPSLGALPYHTMARHGQFKTPTLRNVAKTAPYMHDGSLETLDDVVKFYNNGGRVKEE